MQQVLYSKIFPIKYPPFIILDTQQPVIAKFVDRNKVGSISLDSILRKEKLKLYKNNSIV